ncbi:hypothetical protein HAX54_049046, partial [Datura stramonium]|nr:hypothetical protein [Datura stramonium]
SRICTGPVACKVVFTGCHLSSARLSIVPKLLSYYASFILGTLCAPTVQCLFMPRSPDHQCRGHEVELSSKWV